MLAKGNITGHISFQAWSRWH